MSKKVKHTRSIGVRIAATIGLIAMIASFLASCLLYS